MSYSGEIGGGAQSSGRWVRGWRYVQTLPPGRRILAYLGYLIGPAAIIFALGAGVYSLLWFNHRETATCEIAHVSAPTIGGRGQDIWDVSTSCGPYSISTGGDVLSPTESAELADSLHTDAGNNTYVLQFQGWGPGRLLIGANPAKP